MNRLILLILSMAFLGLTVSSAPAQTAMERAMASGGLPPFLAKMKRHDLTIKVSVLDAEGQRSPAPAGLRLGVSIVAGGAKVRDYHGVTEADGHVVLKGIPSNPEVQKSISYSAWVDYQGVRFRYALDGTPADGAEVDLDVQSANTELGDISVLHSIELFADEEALVVRHIMRLYNEGNTVVSASSLPGGGLALACPEGAKHPELHDEHDPMVEVRGTDIIFTGALMPGKDPAVVNFVYTLPYKDSQFNWVQALPVRTRGFTVALPRYKQPGHQRIIELELHKYQELGELKAVEQSAGKNWQVLRSGKTVLGPGEALRFGISGIPAASHLPRYLLALGILLAIIWVLVMRTPDSSSGGLQRSLSHLLEERDRLIRALARMQRAVARGKMSEPRFKREREAIQARLVSLYRAIDRLEQS